MPRRTTRTEGLYVSGFTELQRSLRRIDGPGNFGLDYEFRRRLKRMGEGVAKAAPDFVTHRTGRHGDPGQPPLGDTVRVHVAQRGVMVDSSSPYGNIQQRGGGPKAGWDARGPHVTRSKASKWMTRAVASQRENIQHETDQLVDWVTREIARG